MYDLSRLDESCEDECNIAIDPQDTNKKKVFNIKLLNKKR